MRRRNFLRLSAAGAASMGAASLLGPWQAQADTIGPLRAAPTTPFAVGVRQYNWMRGNRQVATFVYYPSTGPSGSGPTTNAPVAPGVFPVCQYTHGSGASPQGALAHIKPMAAAGFIVPAPVFTKASVGDTYNGELPRDVSEAITRTLALNTGSDPLAGHIDTANVGVSGYSMGGMTTNALLTAFPDVRIKAAVAMSSIRMGSPSAAVHANVLFIHGDRDTLTTYSSARQSYAEMPAPKAFLTFIGGDHSSYFSDNRAVRTYVDWMRWSLYGDTTARDRLATDATSSGTRWEFVPGPANPTTGPPTTGPTTPPATPSPTGTTPPPTGQVGATYRIVNTWSGGYQAEVTVTAGSAPINGWTVRWTMAGGATISQLWNGTLSTSGSSVTVRNAAYNGSLAANASTTFGFLVNGAPTTPPLTVTTP
ncbi:cellulose binding domain-containing protein [Micromonospora rifamycinica]|uniref:cellulose binding domain-containing protein n=1 Tax=Micromonospora rifamycinica TaxID=291594 RepID=UPI003422A6A0